MGPDLAILLALAVAAAALLVWGAVSRSGSFLLALVAGLVGAAGAMGAYYSAVETGSVGWTLGYAVAGCVGAGVCARQLLLNLKKPS
jgi:hypothetical protein